MPATLLTSLLAAAAAEPERTALVGADSTSVSCQALAERAADWAHGFLAAGVEPGHVVGVHLPRSPDQLAALLGALSCGAAYVPLDPTYPGERLAFMCADLGVGVVAALSPNPVLGAELAWLTPPAPSGAGLRPREVAPSDLAYVIYTSGSSGRPKGVRITHENLDTFLRSWDSLVAPQRRGVWLGLTALSFDPSVVELLWTLARGWTVALAPESPRPGEVGAAIERFGVTHLQCTPTRASMLLAEPTDHAALARLEHLLVGGEALNAALARDLRALVPRVTNIYGPTETTVWAFAHDIDPDAIDPIPIGRPLAEVEAFLADDGDTAELVLAGTDVADGYHNRPDLTPTVFGMRTDGMRTYRTGDLAHRRADGVYEFLGRIDDQVKVAGHRIEPAEIESVLLGSNGVDQVVVVLRETSPGNPRLVAFVRGPVCHDASGEQLTDILRTRCEAMLPPSHVPALFFPVDAFPLTPSGKIDRRAIPLPTSTAAPVATGSFTVQDMCALWSRVLALPVTADDDFFDQGGDSLAALAILSELESAGVADLGLGSLLDAPTPRRLHGLCTLAAPAASQPKLVHVRVSETPRQRLAIVHGAGGNVLNLVHAARRLAPGIDVVAFQADEDERGTPTVAEMAARYVHDLRSLDPEGPYLLAGYSDGGAIAWEMASQLLATGAVVERVVLVDTPLRPSPLREPFVRRVVNVALNVRDRQRPLLRYLRDAIEGQLLARREARPLPEGSTSPGILLYVEDAVRAYDVRPLDVDLVVVRGRATPPAVWSDFRWAPYARSWRVLFAPGDHLEMVHAHHADELAACLDEAIAPSLRPPIAAPPA